MTLRLKSSDADKNSRLESYFPELTYEVGYLVSIYLLSYGTAGI